MAFRPRDNFTRSIHTRACTGYVTKMDTVDCEPDPFSKEGLWKLSRFSIEALQPLEALPWNAALPGTDQLARPIPGHWVLTIVTEIPGSAFQAALETISKTGLVFPNKLDPLEPLEPAPASATNSSTDSQPDTPVNTLPASPEEDIWTLEAGQEEAGYVAALKSWEKFRDQSSREPASAYFSESGAKGFDAALKAQGNSSENQPTAGRLVRSDVFIRSLVCLGLGWSSPFFRYSPQTGAFERVMDNVRVSGVSLSAIDSVIMDLLQCGAHMQRVRAFSRQPSTTPKNLSSLLTLRGTVMVILYNIELQTLGHGRDVVSILQVHMLFQRCGELVGALVDIVDAAEKTRSDAQVISTVMERSAFLAQKFGWIENLVQDIVVRVTRPWFGFIEGWIGLRPEEPALNELIASGLTFAQVEKHEDPSRFNTDSRVEYNYREDHMPSFIPGDQAQTIFETGRSLRLLKSGHPDHPIARFDTIARAGNLHLQFATTWADIERIQQRGHGYESALRAEILEYHKRRRPLQSRSTNPDRSPQNDRPSDEKEITEKTFEMFDIDDEAHVAGSVMDERVLSYDGVNQVLQKARNPDHGPGGSNDRFGPEITAGLYLSLAPIIWTQAQLIDFSLLYHLFKDHKVRHHLNLQWRFQLLGDGSFATKLAYVLFDPEMESGERKSGVVRGGVHTGLRLGSRDTWPPASSELRLVLIGLLGDCYFGDATPEEAEQMSNQKETELPGDLNFAIRDLTSEEIERCRDPNAIEALDFLRLQYKPPRALEALITVHSLGKYDRLFKHLLRLLRMVSVVKGLIRDSTTRGSLSGDTRNVFQKFRIDAQHFVLAISDYCFHVGIGSIWTCFQGTLAKIERCLDRGDIDGTIETAHSVPRLRDYHEDILDQMLFAFFLSKRHAPAAKLLENIFSTILAFGPLSKADGASGIRHENEGTVLHLYATFRKQVSALMGYLRGLESSKASSKPMGRSGTFFTSRTEPTSVFEHLRVRLEMNDYYESV